MKKRDATLTRNTKETKIETTVNLDGPFETRIETGLPFLNHVMEAMACHGGFGLEFKATGDLEVDPHHLIEDCGIVLGQAIAKALDNYNVIQRAGFFSFPMDGSLVTVALDLCGRPNLIWNVELDSLPIGGVDLKLFREYYKALADNLKATIHIQLVYKDNDHHAVEAIAKAFGRALREAIRPTNAVMSTKGIINA